MALPSQLDALRGNSGFAGLPADSTTSRNSRRDSQFLFAHAPIGRTSSLGLYTLRQFRPDIDGRRKSRLRYAGGRLV